MSFSLTPRAIVLALLLTVVCGFWVRQAEIVVLASQITESVPPIPALAVLLALVALNPLLLLLGRRLALTRGEILAIYCFVSVAICFPGPGIMRFWLSLVTAPYYFATPQNGFSSIYPQLPGWLVVKNPLLIRQLYEGKYGGAVPWRAWALPLASWTLFLTLFWICLLCVVVLVRRRWVDEERLSFPIVKLPLEITPDQPGRSPFLRNRLMWSGFGLAALYNGLNILATFLPSLPSPGKSLELVSAVAPPPWNVLQPFTLHYRPELIGFGFLVPTEVCFSIWFFYLLSKVEALTARFGGWNLPGIPFEQEQSIGAYLLLGAWYLWQVRGEFTRFPRPWKRTENLTAGALEQRHAPGWLVATLVISYILLCGFCVLAGMALWVAALFLSIVLITALVSARIRAEAGIPLIWLFPFYLQKKVMLYSLGTAAFLAAPATLTIFALMTLLARGYLPAMAGYQIENLKIAGDSGRSRSLMCAWMVLAAPVGMAIAYYIHLTTYYHYGAQHLGGIWGSWISIPEFTSVVQARTSPQLQDPVRMGATALGAALTALMLAGRSAIVGFPLHPLGYAVATAYGSLVWWSFLIVWVLKVAILRWGGMDLYRKSIPFFLGLALGHFFAAGMVWGILGAFWPDAARSYGVWFG